jgi:hypothetical protein
MKAQILALNHRTFRLLQNRRAFRCRRPDARNPTLVGHKRICPPSILIIRRQQNNAMTTGFRMRMNGGK